MRNSFVFFKLLPLTDTRDFARHEREISASSQGFGTEMVNSR